MFFIDNIITIITIILMLVAWWLFYGKKFFQNLKENPYFENDASQAFASLGVLGTFIGITFGLLFFDTHNLEKSVPALLDGMKSAFFTSIVGMAGSLGTKWFMPNNIPNRNNPKTTILPFIFTSFLKNKTISQIRSKQTSTYTSRSQNKCLITKTS